MNAEYIKERIARKLSEDEYIIDCFCHNCPDKETDSSVWNLRSEWCKCEFDITDGGCARHSDGLEIDALIERIADIATETYRVGSGEE